MTALLPGRILGKEETETRRWPNESESAPIDGEKAKININLRAIKQNTAQSFQTNPPDQRRKILKRLTIRKSSQRLDEKSTAANRFQRA